MKLLLKFALWWMQRRHRRRFAVWGDFWNHGAERVLRPDAEAIHHLDRAIQWLEGQR